MRGLISSIESEYRRYKVLGEGALQQVHETELSRSSGGENSIATIVWHLTGNLKSRFSDFLSSDGEKPWGHRDSEFEARPEVTLVELMNRWDEGWTTLFNALSHL